MKSHYSGWKKLFLVALGIFAGTTFCMKWLEGDFWCNGEKFSIMGLELFYSKQKLAAVLSGLDAHVRTILGYHLQFDFAFMAGVYPGISALCMLAREKIVSPGFKKWLFAMAILQLIAWAADITENLFLLNWIEHPVIGSEFGIYHSIVAAKWIIALAGLTGSVLVLIKRHKVAG